MKVKKFDKLVHSQKVYMSLNAIFKEGFFVTNFTLLEFNNSLKEYLLFILFRNIPIK